MFKYIFAGLLICCLSGFSVALKAETITHSISAKKINLNLAKQFPFSKSFEGKRVIFSEPQILINALDKTLKLQMMITSTNVDEMLLVKTIFTGNMAFDDFSESYFFEDLLLDTFTPQIDSFKDSKPIVKVIKQSLINDFEDIVMFKLEELSHSALRREADEIDISTKQIRFTWK